MCLAEHITPYMPVGSLPRSWPNLPEERGGRHTHGPDIPGPWTWCGVRGAYGVYRGTQSPTPPYFVLFLVSACTAPWFVTSPAHISPIARRASVYDGTLPVVRDQAMTRSIDATLQVRGSCRVAHIAWLWPTNKSYRTEPRVVMDRSRLGTHRRCSPPRIPSAL